MPFVVKYGDGVTIEAPTADDLEAVLSVIDKRRSGCSPAQEAPQGTVSDRMLKLIELLSEQHLGLLYALSGSPAGIDDNGLQARLGFKSRRNIGALLMGITKKARKLGLDMDKQVVTKRVDRSEGGERTYTYRIRPDAINALAASQTPGQHTRVFENGDALTTKVEKFSVSDPFGGATS
jgi:hypothetical protein